MKNWLKKGIIFLLVSSIIYVVEAMIFKDYNYIAEGLIFQIAYIPIYVFITSFVVEGTVEKKEREERIKKLNILVGTFFSEFGNKLIIRLFEIDRNSNQLKGNIKLNSESTKKDFTEANRFLKDYCADMELIDTCNLEKLESTLKSNNDFLLQLMQNPNLLEHESFTEMMIGIFHLKEELQARKNNNSWEKEDIAHIKEDISRVYSLMLGEWVKYLEHLNLEYPSLYLFYIGKF